MNVEMIVSQATPAQEPEAAKVDETDPGRGNTFFAVIHEVAAAKPQEAGENSAQQEEEKKEGQADELSPAPAIPVVFASASAEEILNPQGAQTSAPSRGSSIASAQPISTVSRTDTFPALPPGASAEDGGRLIADVPTKTAMFPSNSTAEQMDPRSAAATPASTTEAGGSLAALSDPVRSLRNNASTDLMPGSEATASYVESLALMGMNRIRPGSLSLPAVVSEIPGSVESDLQKPALTAAANAGDAGDVLRAALNLEQSAISNGLRALRPAGNSEKRDGVRESRSMRSPGSGVEPSGIRFRMLQTAGNSSLSAQAVFEPALPTGQRNAESSLENPDGNLSDMQLPDRKAGNARPADHTLAQSRSAQSGEPAPADPLGIQRTMTSHPAMRASASDTLLHGVFRPFQQGAASTAASGAAGMQPAAQASALEYRTLSALQPLKPAQGSQPPDFLLQLVERIQMQLRDGENTLRIQLKPSSLGRMEIKAETTSAGILATILTESAGVKDYLEHNLHFLQQSFQDQGLKVDRIQVAVHEGFLPHQLSSGNQESRSSSGQQGNSGSVQRNEDRFERPGEEMALDGQALEMIRPHSTFHTIA